MSNLRSYLIAMCRTKQEEKVVELLEESGYDLDYAAEKSSVHVNTIKNIVRSLVYRCPELNLLKKIKLK